MAAVKYSDPASPDEWVEIAERELGNVSGSYVGKMSNDGKVTHCLAAVEAILKAIIWKHNKWNSWPKISKPLRFLYRHDFADLLKACPLDIQDDLRKSAPHWASWQTVSNSQLQQSRYSAAGVSADDANEVARSTRHPDFGVIPWLKKRYQEMK